ncbi:MAG: hypothetical protein OXK80_04215 [Bdellovibrionales bacterium]|nr:hypothetical protein [Bdellovibrionales bacterium]
MTIALIIFIIRLCLNVQVFIKGRVQKISTYINIKSKIIGSLLSIISFHLVFVKTLIVNWMKNTTSLLKFLLGFIVIILFLKIFLDLNYKFAIKFNSSLFSSLIFKNESICLMSDPENTYMWVVKLFNCISSNFLSRLSDLIVRVDDILLFAGIIITIFSIPLFIHLFKGINFFKVKNFLILMLVILISGSFSYSLGRYYLVKFISYPEYRVNIKTKEKIVQIWKGKNYSFYVKCKEHGVSVVEGVNKNDKIFYIGWLDKHIHPNVCSNFF